MKLVADDEMFEWLDTSPDFEWDDGNFAKSATKHGIDRQAAESVFAGELVLAGRIVEPVHGEARWLVLGLDAAKRHAAIVFTRRGDRIRVISSRRMRKKEQKLYEEASET